MSDEQVAETQQTAEAAPADDGGDDGEMVTLTKTQIDRLYQSARNSAFAEARKTLKREPAQQDPRVQRGLELLAKYEAGERQLQDSEARIAPLQERALNALGSRGKTAQQAPSAPAAQGQQSSRLEQMFEMFLTTQLADKMPKAPITYASPGDQLRGDLNAAVADIAEDDPQRHAKVQKTILDKLRGVKVTPGAQSTLTPKKG